MNDHITPITPFRQKSGTLSGYIKKRLHVAAMIYGIINRLAPAYLDPFIEVSDRIVRSKNKLIVQRTSFKIGAATVNK